MWFGTIHIMNIYKTLISIALILIAGFFLINNYIYNEKQNNSQTEDSKENNKKIPQDIQDHINSKSNLIKVNYPKPFDEISSPVEVSGMARGNWFFEASFPITIVDWDGKIIGEGYATAEGDWMTTEFVPFSGTVNFDLENDAVYKRGAIIFRKDNPSDIREFDDALEIPINFE